MRIPKKVSNRIGQATILFILLWTFLYNLIVKEQGLIGSFFTLIDTITEDIVMGSSVTILSVGMIVLVFVLANVYAQILSHHTSFRMLERLVEEELYKGQYRRFFQRILCFDREEPGECVYPLRFSSVFISLSIIYAMSWIYLLVFSELLYLFVQGGLSVAVSNIQLLPVIAISVPLSVRLLAYLKYPYVQNCASLLPTACLLLLLVNFLIYLFNTDGQYFFLAPILSDIGLQKNYIHSGIMLAFSPVFLESIFWMIAIFFSEEEGE